MDAVAIKLGLWSLGISDHKQDAVFNFQHNLADRALPGSSAHQEYLGKLTDQSW